MTVHSNFFWLSENLLGQSTPGRLRRLESALDLGTESFVRLAAAD